jgi:hypothetical protein
VSADWRRIRRRCAALLRSLAIPDPFDLDEFCAALAERRGRPIVLRPVSGVGARLTGLWIATEEPPLDIVVHEARTTSLHRQHIVLHELGHMLAGHAPRTSGAEVVRLLFPDLDPESVRCVLERESYSSTEEQEAEMLASLILLRATSRGPDERGSVEAQRLEAFLSGDDAT